MTFDRLPKSLELLQRMPQVIVRLGKIRSDRQRFLIATDGLLGPSKSSQGAGEKLLRISAIPVLPGSPGGTDGPRPRTHLVAIASPQSGRARRNGRGLP